MLAGLTILGAMVPGGMRLALVLAGLALVVFLAGFGGLLLHRRRIDRKLGEVTAEAARRLGFVYQQQWPEERRAVLDGFSPFRDGRRRKARHVAEGVRDASRVVLLAYSRVVYAGQTSDTWDCEAVFFPDPSSGCPDFHLHPLGLVGKILHLASVPQVDFKDSETGTRFSDHYRVLSPHPAAVRRLLSPEFLEFLAAHPGWSLEARSGRLALWKPWWWRTFASVKPVEDFVAFFEEAWTIRSLLGLPPSQTSAADEPSKPAALP